VRPRADQELLYLYLFALCLFCFIYDHCELGKGLNWHHDICTVAPNKLGLQVVDHLRGVEGKHAIHRHRDSNLNHADVLRGDLSLTSCVFNVQQIVVVLLVEPLEGVGLLVLFVHCNVFFF